MIPGCPTPSHSTAKCRAPVLKRSSNPSLRVAGLQAHATTPGCIYVYVYVYVYKYRKWPKLSIELWSIHVLTSQKSFSRVETILDRSPLHHRIHSSIGTILCAEHWCCLHTLLGYWAQSWMGHHCDTVYQHAGTHFADL